MARKKEIPPKPTGCRRCDGKPFVITSASMGDDTFAMGRCDCPSGAWYRARDNERLVKERHANAVGSFAW